MPNNFDWRRQSAYFGQCRCLQVRLRGLQGLRGAGPLQWVLRKRVLEFLNIKCGIWILQFYNHQGGGGVLRELDPINTPSWLICSQCPQGWIFHQHYQALSWGLQPPKCLESEKIISQTQINKREGEEIFWTNEHNSWSTNSAAIHQCDMEKGSNQNPQQFSPC